MVHFGSDVVEAPAVTATPTSATYYDYTLYMAQSWDENISLQLQDEEVVAAVEQPEPGDLPLPAMLTSLYEEITNTGSSSLAPESEWNPPVDWLQVVGDHRRLRGRESVYGTYVGVEELGEEDPQQSSEPTTNNLLPPTATSSSSPMWGPTSTSSCSSASCSTCPPSTAVNDHNDQVTVNPEVEACYRGDFSREPGLTQRGSSFRQGRDRWHNLNGSLVNRQRERLGNDVENPKTRLAPVPEETSAPGPVGDSVRPPFTKTALGVDAEGDVSTTAGEEANQADTESGLSSDGGTNEASVGFFRNGEWIARPRTSEELRAHRGGQGDVRMRRKRERMQEYFSGQWRPAWLVQYAKDKQKRDLQALDPATRTAQSADQLTPAASTVPCPSTGQDDDWSTWSTTSWFGNEGEVTAVTPTPTQTWEQWEAEASQHRRRWSSWDGWWWDWDWTASTTTTTNSTTLLAEKPTGMQTSCSSTSSSSPSWTTTSWPWTWSSTWTACSPSLTTTSWPWTLTSSSTSSSTWTWLWTPCPTWNGTWTSTTCLGSTVSLLTFSALQWPTPESGVIWCDLDTSFALTTSTTSSTTASVTPAAIPGAGLFPNVQEADPETNWGMQIANSEVALLQEHGLSQASIRRVGDLLAALDNHQANGTGPESRWALARLVSRIEDCADSLEHLLEVLHRRLVHRGFVPVQRVPRREAELMRFFRWISQYGDLCNEIVTRHIAAPLQPQETASPDTVGSGNRGDEHPSSSTDPAPMALARSRSRSRTRSHSEDSSGASQPPLSVDEEDEEAANMYAATLRGDPPALPLWARPGLGPRDLPGVWREQEEDEETTTTTTTTSSSTAWTTTSSPTSWTSCESTPSGYAADLQVLHAVAPPEPGVMLNWGLTSTTTSTSSSGLWPGDVVRDVVNLQAILASQGDRDQVLRRLLDRLRYLQHEQRLLHGAIEELVHWMGPPSTAVSFNGAVMERNIGRAVGREAQFGSGASSSSTSGHASTPTFLLMPGLPAETAQVWPQFAASTPRATVVGYRRRVWRAHLRQLHAQEGLPLPLADDASESLDEQLFILQRDERTAVGALPDGEMPSALRRLDRQGRYGRRRNWQPRQRPLLRDRPPRRPRGPPGGAALPSEPVPHLPARLRQRSRSRDETAALPARDGRGRDETAALPARAGAATPAEDDGESEGVGEDDVDQGPAPEH